MDPVIHSEDPINIFRLSFSLSVSGLQDTLYFICAKDGHPFYAILN
jgi:hypothetical protein